MQAAFALSKNDQCNDTCPQFKRIKKKAKDESSECNNEETISDLSMDDEVPKIYIDEFVDPGIAYEEVLSMTRKNEIFTINGKICKKYNTSGVFLLKLHGELITNPIDIASWNDGKIILADTGTGVGDGKLLLFKKDGLFLRVLVSGISSPAGLDTDQDNNTYVCDRIDNCVLKFNEFGFLVRVLKLFNTPTFVAVGPCCSIVVSDADGIYCLDRYSELVWKQNLITGCKFGILPSGYAVVDHVPKGDALDPVISIVGSNITTFAKSKLGTSGVYIDSENDVWIGVASKRYFRQLFIANIGYDMQNPPIFETGQILEEIGENERRNDVIKYGAESGLTRGALNVDGSYVRIESKELNILEKDFYGTLKKNLFIMYGQREVMNIGDRNFFELGDSGAFVFMLFQEERPKCVGMAIGKTSYGSCICTPIGSVLQSLGFRPPLKLKSFLQPYYTAFPNSPILRSSPLENTKRSKKHSKISKNEDKPSFGFRLNSHHCVSADVLKSVEKNLAEKIDKMGEKYEKRMSRMENSLLETKHMMKNLCEKSGTTESEFQTPRKKDKRKLSECPNFSPTPAKKVFTFSPEHLQPDTPNDAEYEFDIFSVELNTPKSNDEKTSSCPF